MHRPPVTPLHTGEIWRIARNNVLAVKMDRGRIDAPLLEVGEYCVSGSSKRTINIPPSPQMPVCPLVAYPLIVKS